MLPALTDLLSLLDQRPEVTHLQVLDYEVAAGIVSLVKIRGDFPDPYAIQIRLRLQGNMVGYSYQLFTTKPIIRWDNAPHHPAVATSPHHFHDDTDTIYPSSLSGDPPIDLPTVLAEMLNYIRSH
jgi:hypothetical protein